MIVLEGVRGWVLWLAVGGLGFGDVYTEDDVLIWVLVDDSRRSQEDLVSFSTGRTILLLFAYEISHPWRH